MAVLRALTKLGIAMASIKGIKNIAQAIPAYPVIKPAMARPLPARAPPAFLILERALCPQITPGMAAKIEKHVKLKMPKTRLQMASAEVFGCDGMAGGGDGMDSFIYLVFYF